MKLCFLKFREDGLCESGALRSEVGVLQGCAHPVGSSAESVVWEGSHEFGYQLEPFTGSELQVFKIVEV